MQRMLGLVERLGRLGERHRPRVVLALDAEDLDHVGVGTQAVLVGPLVAEPLQLEQRQFFLGLGGRRRDARRRSAAA